MRIVVLGGAGAMGRVTVRDLVESPDVSEVVIADFNAERAEALADSLKSPRVRVARVDVNQEASLDQALRGADAAINCTWFQTNLTVMRGCLRAGCHYLDLGGLYHMTVRQMALDREFRKAGLLAILGAGASPGMTNVMARYAADRMERVDKINVRIGAADFAPPDAPLVAPYSIRTILDELTRKPVVFDGGQVREVEPLSGEEMVAFPAPVGPAPAILALHSEVATLPSSFAAKGVQECNFKIAFPGEFLSKLKFLIALGLDGDEPIPASGARVRPRDLLIEILSRVPEHQTAPDDCDIIRVEVAGESGGRKVEMIMEAVVFPHGQWGVGAGALDTGIPPSIMAQMLLRGDFRATGAIAPEACIPPEPFFRELKARGISVYSQETRGLA